MSERIMLRLGDFNFEIATAAYQQYIAKQGARWAEQERLGRYPALQFVGQTTPEISLNGVLYPGALGTGHNTREVSITPLRSLMAAGKPLSMVSGLGDVCGQWVVTDVSDTRTVFLDNGEARKIEFAVSLKYYGPDATGQAGPSSYGQASTAGQGVSVGGAFPMNMGDIIAALPPLTTSSPLSAVSAVADVVGTVVQSATAAASEVVKAATGLASEIANDVASVIPQPVLGIMRDMAHGAETVLTLGGFVGDTLSAIKAMDYTGQSDPRATLTALQRGMAHISDTTRLIGITVGAGTDILDRTATTWDAVNGLSALPQPTSRVADVCRKASGVAGNLSALCLETNRHSAALRDKISVEDDELPPEDEDVRRERIFKGLTDVKDRLILCLPEIANAEYARANNRDKIGWAYFHEFISKWLHGKAYTIKGKYDYGEQLPSFVNWNWLMGYQRFSQTVKDMLDPNYLFSEAAKEKLISLLEQEGAFLGEGATFNHIALDTLKQRAKAFQGKTMDYWLFEAIVPALPVKPDGLQATVATTTVYALASGHTKVTPEGGKKVFVERVALFIHDGFEFSGDQWLGNWVCKDNGKAFDMLGIILNNETFRNFRSRVKNYGGDFRIMCTPEVVWEGDFSYTAN